VKPTRIALGGIMHETHTFAEVPTGMRDFEIGTFHRGAEILEQMGDTRAGIAGMMAVGAAHAWELLPTLYTMAMPSGAIEQATYDTLADEFVERLRAALPLDGVLLMLHGAMVTDDLLDPEADILRRVREVTGPDIPVVVEMDLHGNISPAMTELADAVVAFDANPHIDAYERGIEAAEIMCEILDGRIAPVVGMYQTNLLLSPQVTGTADLPLRAALEAAWRFEDEEDVVCVSVFGGFAYADTPFTRCSVVATVDGDVGRARQIAGEVGAIAEAGVGSAHFVAVAPDEAVRQALAIPGGPVILVDSADNIGGGTPGDGTDALRALLAIDAQEATVAIADPAAARACHEAGVGGQIDMEIGGKADTWHGAPVRVAGEVRALTDGYFEFEMANSHLASFRGKGMDMGPSAWLRVGGINIALNTNKTPPFDLGQLRSLGIQPESQKLIAVKAAVAHRAAYEPIAAGVVEMDTAGLCTANLGRFPYKNLQRPLYPLDGSD
jgi:microcystin degradation protein MlrC